MNNETTKKKRAKNSWAKERPFDNPYVIITHPNFPGWEWRILKAYQTAKNEAANPYARWLMQTKGVGTFGHYSYGDGYISEVPCTDALIDALRQRTIDDGDGNMILVD